MTRLFGKTALIASACSDAGGEIAISLAHAGAQVLIHDDGLVLGGNEIVAQMRQLGTRTDRIVGDLSKPGGPEQLARATQKIVGGRLDILVACAGDAPGKEFQEITVPDFDRFVATEIRAPFFLIQQLLPILSSLSSIVFVSSRSDQIDAGLSTLSTTMGALESLVRYFALALGPSGVRVNRVTAEGTDHYKTGKDGLVSERSTSQAGSEAVARLVTFLSSDAARWITGQSIRSARPDARSPLRLSAENFGPPHLTGATP